MIQRIQSLFLLISTILIASLFFIPLAKLLSVSSVTFDIYFNGIFDISKNIKIETDTITIFILLSIILIISLFSLFFYKKRILQIRLIVFNILLLFGLVFLVYFVSFQALKEIEAEILVFSSAITYIPIISIIFNLMAIRNIKKDEKLVKSYDRIR